SNERGVYTSGSGFWGTIQLGGNGRAHGLTIQSPLMNDTITTGRQIVRIEVELDYALGQQASSHIGLQYRTYIGGTSSLRLDIAPATLLSAVPVYVWHPGSPVAISNH